MFLIGLFLISFGLLSDASFSAKIGDRKCAPSSADMNTLQRAGCPHGCQDGYRGRLCTRRCPQNCLKCDRDSGNCFGHCLKGYFGLRCRNYCFHCDSCDITGNCMEYMTFKTVKHTISERPVTHRTNIPETSTLKVTYRTNIPETSTLNVAYRKIISETSTLKFTHKVLITALSIIFAPVLVLTLIILVRWVKKRVRRKAGSNVNQRTTTQESVTNQSQNSHTYEEIDDRYLSCASLNNEQQSLTNLDSSNPLPIASNFLELISNRHNMNGFCYITDHTQSRYLMDTSFNNTNVGESLNADTSEMENMLPVLTCTGPMRFQNGHLEPQIHSGFSEHSWEMNSDNDGSIKESTKTSTINKPYVMSLLSNDSEECFLENDFDEKTGEETELFSRLKIFNV